MEINNVVVIGSGLMGSGIAYEVLKSGRKVVIVDREQQFIDAGMSKIRDAVKDGISRNKMSPMDGQKMIGNISNSTDLASVAGTADLVIEAAFEDMDVKKEIFSQLSSHAKPDAILVSNTSTLSISEIASVVSQPERVAGLHFFSPVPAMKLVEVISGKESSKNTIGILTKFAEEIGKTPVVCKDSPGFIVNRVLVPIMVEAMKLYDDGIASMEDIDKALQLGANFPVGPFTLTDFVGLDVSLASIRTLEREFGEHYKPSPTLVKLVEEGKLGIKTKEGFFKY